MTVASQVPFRGSFFQLRDGGIGVVCGGEALRARALVLVARVGSTRVDAVRLVPNGGGFMGKLSGTPQQGDKLYVQYPPEPEIDTGVVYQAPPAQSVA